MAAHPDRSRRDPEHTIESPGRPPAVLPPDPHLCSHAPKPSLNLP